MCVCAGVCYSTRKAHADVLCGSRALVPCVCVCVPDGKKRYKKATESERADRAAHEKQYEKKKKAAMQASYKVQV